MTKICCGELKGKRGQFKKFISSSDSEMLLNITGQYGKAKRSQVIPSKFPYLIIHITFFPFFRPRRNRKHKLAGNIICVWHNVTHTLKLLSIFVDDNSVWQRKSDKYTISWIQNWILSATRVRGNMFRSIGTTFKIGLWNPPCERYCAI